MFATLRLNEVGIVVPSADMPVGMMSCSLFSRVNEGRVWEYKPAVLPVLSCTPAASVYDGVKGAGVRYVGD